MEEEMRLNFRNIGQPKRIAKRISACTELPLSNCQEALARAVGYRNWHDLRQVTPGIGGDDQPLALTLNEQADLIVKIVAALEAQAGDVQFALCDAGVSGPDSQGLGFQHDLRALVFRKTTIPDQGRRQPGSVGKLKHDARLMILRSFSGLVSGITHRSHDTGVADFEFITPRKAIPLFIPARLYLAYGAWTEQDGALVLHSRDYLPMWRIRANRRPERLNPADWIYHDDNHDKWFWGDHSAPWDSEKRRQEETARLESYGIRGMPLLVEVLPDMIFNGREVDEEDAAKLRFGSTSNIRHLNPNLRKSPEVAQ
jgi:hypothetical protein